MFKSWAVLLSKKHGILGVCGHDSAPKLLFSADDALTITLQYLWQIKISMLGQIVEKMWLQIYNKTKRFFVSLSNRGLYITKKLST